MDREEAIKIVQSATVWTDEERDALAMLIPELAESEDERQRRTLIEWLKDLLVDYREDGDSSSLEMADKTEGWIAYLEKQKEQKYIGLSKADKLFLQDVADVLGDNEYKDAAKRLRDLSESLYLQPKAEWNKEDEIMLKWIEDILLIADDDLNDKLNGEVSPITDSAYSSMKICIAKCRFWLKSLRPQYHGDVTMTEAYKMGLEAGKASSWKPSEEQMEALNTLNLHGDLSYVGQQNQLISLYQDLKKLM